MLWNIEESFILRVLCIFNVDVKTKGKKRFILMFVSFCVAVSMDSMFRGEYK